MAAQEEYSIVYKAKIEVDDLKKGIGEIQKNLDKINVPNQIEKSLKSSISKLEKEFANFDLGLKTDLKDTKNFENLAKTYGKIIEFSNQYNSILRNISNYDSSDFIPKGTLEKIQAIDKAAKDYEKTLKRLNNSNIIKEKENLIKQKTTKLETGTATSPSLSYKLKNEAAKLKQSEADLTAATTAYDKAQKGYLKVQKAYEKQNNKNIPYSNELQSKRDAIKTNQEEQESLEKSLQSLKKSQEEYNKSLSELEENKKKLESKKLELTSIFPPPKEEDLKKIKAYNELIKKSFDMKTSKSDSRQNKLGTELEQNLDNFSSEKIKQIQSKFKDIQKLNQEIENYENQNKTQNISSLSSTINDKIAALKDSDKEQAKKDLGKFEEHYKEIVSFIEKRENKFSTVEEYYKKIQEEVQKYNETIKNKENGFDFLKTLPEGYNPSGGSLSVFRALNAAFGTNSKNGIWNESAKRQFFNAGSTGNKTEKEIDAILAPLKNVYLEYKNFQNLISTKSGEFSNNIFGLLLGEDLFKSAGDGQGNFKIQEQLKLCQDILNVLSSKEEVINKSQELDSHIAQAKSQKESLKKQIEDLFKDLNTPINFDENTIQQLQKYAGIAKNKTNNQYSDKNFLSLSTKKAQLGKDEFAWINELDRLDHSKVVELLKIAESINEINNAINNITSLQDRTQEIADLDDKINKLKEDEKALNDELATLQKNPSAGAVTEEELEKQREKVKLKEEEATAAEKAKNAAEATHTTNQERYKKISDDIDKLTREREALEKEKDALIQANEQSAFSGIIQQLQGSNIQIPDTVKNIEQLKTYLEQLNQTGIADVAKYLSLINQESDKIDSNFSKNNKIKDSFQEATNAAKDFDSQLGMVKNRIKYFFGLSNAIQLVKRSIREAYNTVKELDAAMTESAVVTQYSIADMWAQLPKYTQTANELGVTTKGVYETMTLFYQQGLKTNEVFEIGTETLKMARIAGIDYATATDYK